VSHDAWGPRYGDPSHPTTGELPRVGNGHVTDEQRTIQVDTVAEPPRQESRSRYSYSWESRAGVSEPRSDEWSAPRVGREGSAPQIAPEASQPHGAEGFQPGFGSEGSQPRHGESRPHFGTEDSPPRFGDSQPRFGTEGSAPRPRRGDTTQFARVGDGVRGSVGPVTVQVDHVRMDGGTTGDTQLLPTANFMRPQEEQPPAVQSPQPEPGTGSMPAMRHQIGPDWTQMPLRLLAAAVVATAVLGASAASLITIGNWINP